MGETLSADQVREKHLAAMGPDLGGVYNALEIECAWMHVKWHEYTELYGTRPDRLDVLNSSAGFFFRIVQDVMWDDALLHLARMTDRQSTASRANLTIQALPTYLTDHQLLTDVGKDIAAAVTATAFARDWRNRRIAHSDLELALKQGAKPLEPASRLQVRQALDAIANVLNRVHAHYLGGSVLFSEIAPIGGAISLLRTLRDGVEHEERRRDRLRAGKPEPGDIGPGRPI